MKRVMVIGCPGSGKSCFSRALRDATGLPLCYLDMLYWRADRTHVTKEEFRAMLADVLALNEWIIDGNYGSTLEMRMQACDTVVFLDYPTEVCLAGIEARRGRPREDMPWVEADGYADEDFESFVRAYNSESRPKVMALLEKYADRAIYRFTSREMADAFLKSLNQIK